MELRPHKRVSRHFMLPGKGFIFFYLKKKLMLFLPTTVYEYVSLKLAEEIEIHSLLGLILFWAGR